MRQMRRGTEALSSRRARLLRLRQSYLSPAGTIFHKSTTSLRAGFYVMELLSTWDRESSCLCSLIASQFTHPLYIRAELKPNGMPETARRRLIVRRRLRPITTHHSELV